MDAAKHEAAMLAAAQRTLDWAAAIIYAHARDPVFQKRIQCGKGDYRMVSLHLSGVLKVHDAQTGVLLAESQAGRLNVLRLGTQPETSAEGD